MFDAKEHERGIEFQFRPRFVHQRILLPEQLSEFDVVVRDAVRADGCQQLVHSDGRLRHHRVRVEPHLLHALLPDDYAARVHRRGFRSGCFPLPDLVQAENEQR